MRKSIPQWSAAAVVALGATLFGNPSLALAGPLIDNGSCRPIDGGGAICDANAHPVVKKGSHLLCNASGGPKYPPGCLVMLGPEKLGIPLKPGQTSSPLPHDGQLFLTCTGGLTTNCSIRVSP